MKFKEDKFINIDLIGDRIMAQIELSSSKRRYRLWGYRVAAAVIIAFVSSFSVYMYLDTSISTTNMELALKLPDHSTVRLEENTTIRYNRFAWYTNNKNVYLSGRAIFKVEKGGLFTVKTNQGSVSVLGTEFLVDSSTDSLFVECYSGSVLVETKAGKIILTQDERIIYHGDSIVKSPIYAKYIEFNNTSLSIVLDKMEEIYNVRFVRSKGADSVLFTGVVATGDIDEALDVIGICCNFDFDISNDTTIITLIPL